MGGRGASGGGSMKNSQGREVKKTKFCPNRMETDSKRNYRTERIYLVF